MSNKAYLNALHEEGTNEDIIYFIRKLEEEIPETVKQSKLEECSRKDLLDYLVSLDIKADSLK